jgi:hypothetical protein
MKEGTWMVGKPSHLKTREQLEAVGVWIDPTQTPAHYLKKSSNLRNPGAPRGRLEPTRKLLSESRWQLLLHPDVNLDQKVSIVPPLTTRIFWETNGGESWNI